MSDNAIPPAAPLPPPAGGRAELTAAQRASIERTDQSMAVTSGAGCGKTFVLTQRYLRLLDQDGRPDAPARVVAVTFTDKAALEMRQRVAGQLARRTDPLAAAWRRNLTQARISTIHGFAASLLRTWPVEAGVDPSFSVLADEFRRTQMRQAACQDALRAGLDRQSEPVAELLGALGYSRVLDMLATLLDERWRWSAREYADYEKTLQTWRQQREKIAQEAWQDPKVQAAGKELALRIKVEAGDRLADHLLMQRKIISALLYDPAARTPDTFSQLATAGNLGSAKAWESKEQMMDVRASLRRLVALLGDLAPLHGPLNERDTQSAKLLATLTGIAAAAIGRYRAAKRRAGLLDFVDLQSAALHLLRRHEMVRLRVAEGITQLLIDEFQDTDSLQRELLYLAVDCQGPKPPPGRIFFVGDAKQSIYRFRGAEVEVFEQARQAIDPAGRQNLDLNFRTHRGGVALVNRIFRPLMGDAYEPLVAHRRELPELPAAEVVLADCPGGNAYTRYRAGARATADRIAWMLADGERHIWDEKQNQWRPVRPGDVAILLPRLQNTGPFEDALDEHGIPYFVIAGAGLFNQQEVHDLISALRAIDNPLDDIALMGFLRGQMVGLDDNTLAHVALGVSPPYRLNLCDPQAPGRLPVSLAERLALPAAGRLAWAMSLLEHLAAAKDACGPEELIRRLLELTSYEALLLAQHHGRRKVGNIRRVLAHAASAVAAGATLREFIEFVAGLTVQEVRAEQAATEIESGDVVRLMTIHKAKGLEFPIVFLADLNYPPQTRFDNLSVRGPLGLTLRGGRDDEEDKEETVPQSWATAKWLERKAEMAEDLRTFYVAVTRHRDFIAFVGAAEMTEDGSLGRSGSMLRLLYESLGLREETLDLGDGALLLNQRVKISRPQRRGRQSILDELCAKSDGPTALATALANLGAAHVDAPPLPLLGAPGRRSLERIPARALALLAHCPASFHWHYELRVPGPAMADRPLPTSLARLDGPTEDAVLARCLELVDLENPPRAELLARQALAEQGVNIDFTADGGEIASMLSSLSAHPLWQTLKTARRLWRPVAFTTRTGRLEIVGTIDALLQDAAGQWQLVLFCTDDVSATDAAACAQTRRLQMEICLAAGRRLLEQQGPGRGQNLHGSFYFLRPAVAHAWGPPDAAASANGGEIDALADRLDTCRQTDSWPMCRGAHCQWCRYRPLCDSPGLGGPQETVRL